MEQRLQEADRRRFRRTTVHRTGKVYLRSALRFLPVRALDVSLGGLLLEIKSDRPLRVGEPIDVLIADTGRAILAADDTVEARIAHVRTMPDGVQRVGLAFAREGALAAIAA